MQRLLDLMGTPDIKIITGVRRSDTLTANLVVTNHKTVGNYIKYLCDAYGNCISLQAVQDKHFDGKPD